jgi:V/A-type H+-transporting ATPase subunit I
VKGEGGRPFIELPEVMSNVLSYTWLIAIGMSKAGMALAFNFIAIELIGGRTPDVHHGSACLHRGTPDDLILRYSRGLHAIRLQYSAVQQFFEGGGWFNPLR